MNTTPSPTPVRKGEAETSRKLQRYSTSGGGWCRDSYGEMVLYEDAAALLAVNDALADACRRFLEAHSATMRVDERVRSSPCLCGPCVEARAALALAGGAA